MSLSAVKKELGEFNWEQYRSWPDDERWELIDGVAHAMSSPTSRHQHILGNLFNSFHTFFKGRRCHPFIAPLDVKLSDWDVVQPDLLVVCEPKQIKETHIEGAPALVLEVLSRSTEEWDRLDKLELYARHGVQEYWIVTPFPSMVEVLTLDGTYYRIHKVFSKSDTLIGPLFPEFQIPLGEIFDFELTLEEEAMLRVKEPPAQYSMRHSDGVMPVS